MKTKLLFGSLVFIGWLRSGGLLTTGSEAALNMLLWNAIGMVVLLAFYGVSAVILFYSLDKLDLFRVQPKDEEIGLDWVKHQEKAYDIGT